MKLTTTLNIIREHSPCTDSWKKALQLLGKTGPDDESLSYEWILDNLGICDAIWALQACRESDKAGVEREARLFACDCAESVLENFESKYPQDGRVRECINVSRMFARGEADDAARSAAWSAAWSAVRSAADSAARSAARSAAWSAAQWTAWSAADSAADSAAQWAARSAVWSAADSAARDKQTEIFRQYFCTE